MNNQPVSIKYFEGTFYSSTWVTVYVPLTDLDCEQFKSAVLKEEKKKNRALTVRELVEVARNMPQ